jgi:integrase
MPQPSVRRAGLLSMVGTLLSTSFASGADVKTVQARLRHASAKTTLDTYGHLWPRPGRIHTSGRGRRAGRAGGESCGLCAD